MVVMTDSSTYGTATLRELFNGSVVILSEPSTFWSPIHSIPFWPLPVVITTSRRVYGFYVILFYTNIDTVANAAFELLSFKDMVSTG